MALPGAVCAPQAESSKLGTRVTSLNSLFHCEDHGVKLTTRPIHAFTQLASETVCPLEQLGSALARWVVTTMGRPWPWPQGVQSRGETDRQTGNSSTQSAVGTEPAQQVEGSTGPGAGGGGGPGRGGPGCGRKGSGPVHQGREWGRSNKGKDAAKAQRQRHRGTWRTAGAVSSPFQG